MQLDMFEAAPPGFIAIPKPEDETVNICTFCDWRPHCQNWKPEYTQNPRYRCMPWARPDGESVIFKRATV